jgi:hypothetical protein
MKDIAIKIAIAVISFAAGLASTLFLIPFWWKPLASAIDEGKPADWIGFAGNFGAGLMTLIAAAGAIYGATFAARPVYDQLRELARQSDIANLGVLAKRAIELNNERILIYRVYSGVVLISTHLRNLLSGSGIPETPELVGSIDLFENAVDDLRKNAGIVWGNANIQNTRREFLDAAFGAASNIMNVNRLNPKDRPNRVAAFKANAVTWAQLSNDVRQLGQVLHDAVEISTARTSAMLADLEQRVF